MVVSSDGRPLGSPEPKRSSSYTQIAATERVSSRQEARRHMSEDNIGKIVSFTLDVDNPPPFTDDEWNQLERLRAMKDEDIDFSDIPRQTGAKNWHRPGLFGGPIGRLRRAALKEGILLVEPEVKEFFEKSGEGFGERMNAVLREYVETHRKTA